MIKVITSKDNPRIKFAASLKEKKYREQYQCFIAETKKSLEMALLSKCVSEVFATEYLDIPEDIPQYLVSEDILKKIDMVGNDLALAQGMCGAASGSIRTNVGQPTIRVSEILVGGRGGELK